MTPPRPRDPEATRAALLRAASSAFATHGFAGARTQALADAAGVNKALILYYFESKQGLYSAVLLDHIERAQAAITGELDPAATPPERLDAFVGALGRYMGDEPDFAPLVMREQMDGSHRLEPEVRTRFFGFFGTSRAILEEGIADGSFRRLDPHATHLSLVGSLVMYQLTRPARETYRREGDPPGPIPEWGEYVEHVRHLFAIGLRPPSKSG